MSQAVSEESLLTNVAAIAWAIRDPKHGLLVVNFPESSDCPPAVLLWLTESHAIAALDAFTRSHIEDFGSDPGFTLKVLGKVKVDIPGDTKSLHELSDEAAATLTKHGR
jgi:hypothetical protein